MCLVNVEAAEIGPLDEHCVVVRKGVYVVTEGELKGDGFLWVEGWLWVDDSPSVRRLGSVYWDTIVRYFGLPVGGSEREYPKADGGRYVVMAVHAMVELAIFPGVQEWPITGDGRASREPWAEGLVKEVFIAKETEEPAPDGPCRVAGAFLLGGRAF